MTGIRFIVRISSVAGVLTLYGAVTRNTLPERRPWRINVFNVEKTALQFPHLEVSKFPSTADEIMWHLSAQPGVNPLGVEVIT